MVTRLTDGRGKITLKGHEISDGWKRLVKEAARRNGQTVAGFVAPITTEAAQQVIKGKPAVPSVLPVRLEDAVASLGDQITRQRAKVQGATGAELERRDREAEAQPAETSEGLAAMEPAGRRGRWRRK